MSHLTCQSRHGSPSWLPVVPSIRPPGHLVSSLSNLATLPQTRQDRTNLIGKHRPESMPIVNMLSGSTLKMGWPQLCEHVIFYSQTFSSLCHSSVSKNCSTVLFLFLEYSRISMRSKLQIYLAKGSWLNICIKERQGKKWMFRG